MQIPAAFDYERATSVENALELLQARGPEARLLAGGHSLLPMMKLRLAAPECLIDIDSLAHLVLDTLGLMPHLHNLLSALLTADLKIEFEWKGAAD